MSTKGIHNGTCYSYQPYYEFDEFPYQNAF